MKAQIAEELRGRLPLALLLAALSLPASSYYYASAAARRPDPHAGIRPLIHKISTASGNTYGSPRMWLALRNRGVFFSEKVVRRLMKEERIEVRYARRKHKYSSYAGELIPAVENLVSGDFHADAPDELWLTDITEFAASDAKVYLSPIIDCFDGIKWRKASDLEAAIDEYIDFYNNRRITAKLDGMTIAEHRDKLAKVSRKAS